MLHEYNVFVEEWKGMRTRGSSPDIVAKISGMEFANPLSVGDSVYLSRNAHFVRLYLGIVRRISQTGKDPVDGAHSMSCTDVSVLMDDGDDEDQKISPVLRDRLKSHRVER